MINRPKTDYLLVPPTHRVRTLHDSTWQPTTSPDCHRSQVTSVWLPERVLKCSSLVTEGGGEFASAAPELKDGCRQASSPRQVATKPLKQPADVASVQETRLLQMSMHGLDSKYQPALHHCSKSFNAIIRVVHGLAILRVKLFLSFSQVTYRPLHRPRSITSLAFREFHN